MNGLSILTNLKGEIYDLILVIMNQLTKMMYYKPVNIIINTFRLVEIILDIVV